MYRTAAAALIILSLAGCGKSAAKKQQDAAAAAAAAHWRSGLTHWGASMQGAINGLSVLFSDPASVRGLQAGDKRTGAKLARFEHTLSGCTAAVERIGSAPAAFAASRREALRACTDLEHGAELVRTGITQLQHGLGVDLLNQSSAALGTGEDEVRRAKLDLRPPS
jgi:hypothetical protein